jgi:hypothetical protein
METERSLMFAYVRVNSLMFAFFEKSVFFPALWRLDARTQSVGFRRVLFGFWADAIKIGSAK